MLLSSGRELTGIGRWNNSQNYLEPGQKIYGEQDSEKIPTTEYDCSRSSIRSLMFQIVCEASTWKTRAAYALRRSRVRTDVGLAFDKTDLDCVSDKLGGAFDAE
jgi:hypothetical protein